MIDIIRTSIRNKLLFIFLIVLAFILMAVYNGFATMNRVLHDYEAATSDDTAYVIAISALNIRFKTQVQEWKNTLIRGKDPKQLQKYWDRFETNGEAIQQEYRRLLQQIPRDRSYYSNVQQFADSYPTMFQAYRSGYQEFIASGFDIAVGDRSVKGIDREPTQYLNAALEKAQRSMQVLAKELDEDAVAARSITTVVILVVSAVGIVAFTLFIGRGILTPLDHVMQTSKTIAKGDFTHPLQRETHDQLGELTDNFKHIQHELGGIVANVIGDLKELSLLIDSLFTAFNSIKGGLAKQTEETSILVVDMREMNDTNERISASIKQVNDFVRGANEHSSEGLAMFDKNLAVSQSMLDASQSGAEIITRLKNDSDEIGNVVGVINSIAEQTNLLALNAAIEAARAGENGRGFAVVADEVRSLANKTQQSTTQISATIAGLQKAADEAVEAMDKGNEQAQISLQHAHQSKNFIAQINQSFNDIRQLNSDVLSKLVEQEQHSVRVNKGLSSIDELSAGSQHEANVMIDASKVLSDILKRIQSVTAEFKLPQV